MTKEVTLSSNAYPSIVSRLRAWIDERGLVIEGQDLGPGVSSIWGDSDYEYWLQVGRGYLDRVLASLAGKLDLRIDLPTDESERDILLLELIRGSWDRGLFESDVDFRRWLNAIHVPSKFSSYA